MITGETEDMEIQNEETSFMSREKGMTTKGKVREVIRLSPRGIWSALLILLAGVGIATLLVAFRATPPKAPVERVATPVVAVTAKKGTTQFSVQGYGTVSAKNQLEVRPQVAGHLVSLHPAMELGGRIAKEEVLFQIDPRDYQIAVESEKANLERARFELKLEQGNQIVAEREWKLLEKGVSGSPLGEELALRKPHLQEKQAALRAAQSRLQKAQLDLERTEIRAPFSAVVLEESLEIGRYVSPANPVATLASIDEFYVTVQIPQAELPTLGFHASGQPDLENTQAKILQQLGPESAVARSAKVVRLVGDVDQRGRMARVLVSVENPLDPPAGELPLLLGTYVGVELLGNTIEGVYALPRSALREGGVVYVASKESLLQIRAVETVFTQGEQAFVRGDLKEAERVIVSPMRDPLKGTLVRVTRLAGSSEQEVSREQP